MKRWINQEEHDRAEEHFKKAQKAYAKYRKHEVALGEILESGDALRRTGCISDAIVDGGSFDVALSKEDIVIAT